MRTTTALLLPLLAKAFGADADLVSEDVRDDGQVLVTWRLLLPAGVRRLRSEPLVLVSRDGKTLRWNSSGYPDRHFTLHDLAEADPANESNRHPHTIELAQRLKSSLHAANLMSSSGSVAFAASLEDRHICPESAAALVASATGQEFWGLLRHIYLAWRYRLEEGVLSLPPPYSKVEAAAAHAVVSEEWFEQALKDTGRILANGDLFLPIISNTRSGLYCTQV